MNLESENAGSAGDPRARNIAEKLPALALTVRAWLGPLAGAVVCYAVVGCRNQPEGATLTYAVQCQGMPDAEEAKREVVKVVNHRINGAGEARLIAGSRMEVSLYGEPTTEDVKNFERLISAPGIMEFRVMAAPADARHKPLIELAEQLAADKEVLRVEDRRVARWVEFSAEEFGDLEQARARGLIVRLAGQIPQALALVDDQLDVTSQYIQSAGVDVDETGRPQIGFSFNPQGAFKFGTLTGNHAPKPTGERYMLGILLDNRLLSAPTIESKITDRGLISGGAMSVVEVEEIVRILNSGPLPCKIKPLGPAIMHGEPRE